jgi:radical SAM superfamily enzyme with C-terminal helix-hairpin-helix motif
MIDVAVVDHGYRSATGVPYPLDPNTASMDELRAIPGIGTGRAGDIVVNRPHEPGQNPLASADVDLSEFTGRASGESRAE